MERTVIVGAGVIGLALAEELARRNLRVTVLDRGAPDEHGTSWAAAGIIPPANWQQTEDPYGQLCQWSVREYGDWCARLHRQTGIDPEYWPCGGIQLARSVGDAAALASAIALWRSDGITVEPLSSDKLLEHEPSLHALVERHSLRAVYWVPGEAQVRSSRLLKSLRHACQQQGVDIQHNVDVCELVCEGNQTRQLRTSQGYISADQVCLATGSWTDQLLSRLGMTLDIQPWRGQMALLDAPRGLLRHVINEGPRYLVPRRDGRLLVGATVEEAGYDWRTTEAVDELREYAVELIPSLSDAPLVRGWSGLRPHTNDGSPYLGKVPGLENTYVAAGHFRSGILLAPATARVMSDLMTGVAPPIDMTAFRLDR